MGGGGGGTEEGRERGRGMEGGVWVWGSGMERNVRVVFEPVLIHNAVSKRHIFNKCMGPFCCLCVCPRLGLCLCVHVEKPEEVRDSLRTLSSVTCC